MDKIRIGDNEYQPPFKWKWMNVYDANGEYVISYDKIAALNELATLRQERDALVKRVEELGKQVEIGVIEFHTSKNAELRDEFYEVVDDLRNAGSIVDVWLLDIGAVLRKHGYTMRVYRNNPTTKGGE